MPTEVSDPIGSIAAPPARIFLRTHLGLGDHIACNALARHFAQCGELVLPVKQHNAPSVAFMLRDTGALIVPVADDAEADAYIAAARGDEDTVTDICFYQGPRHQQFFEAGLHFDEFFYTLAQLDPASRYRAFHVDRSQVREAALAARFEPFAARRPYVFLHEDPARGFMLDRTRLDGDLPIISPRPGLTENIFDYSLLIENAAAVHCFDSSFALLVDYMDLAPDRRFLHEYVRTYPKVSNGHLLNPRYRDDGWMMLRESGMAGNTRHGESRHDSPGCGDSSV